MTTTHLPPSRPTAPPEPTAPPSTQPTSRAWLRRLVRGAESDPAWARPALLALLVATAAFYLVGLTANGYANSFYSAAAQAGSQSWTAWFFGSLDAGNAITVDKPPASLWVMGLSVRLFGLSSAAILVPEVLMGVATVGVLHATVKRAFGAGAGLLAGVALALTPVAVLMFRFNNPDALLVLLMTLAAWATLRATERGSVRWFALAGALIGLGFLTKTLQVLLVVPFLGVAWLLAAPTTLRRRVLGALVGVGAMLLAAGWWVAVVELVPASWRPYVGGSQTDSFLELTFGYNGFGRLSGTEVGSVGGGGPNAGTGSIWRMFTGTVGGQISWLIPSALVLLVMGLVMRGRAPRTDARRAAYLVWGGWLLVTGLTFSLMAGIFHEYYTVALAPAVAALVGMGASEAWQRRHTTLGQLTLSAATAAAAVWGFVLLTRTTAYGDGLRIAVLALGLVAAFGFLVVDRIAVRAVPVVAALALAAGLAGPAAYSVSTVTSPHTGSIVTAGPATGQSGLPGMPGMPGARPGGAGGGPVGGPATGQGGGMGGLLDASTPSTDVVAALTTNASAYRWVAAAVGSQNAAGLQLGTGEPVMAIGGFNGSDPSPTLAQFQQYVADGQIHYLLAGGGFAGQNGGSNAASEITAWAQAHYTAVTIGGQTFYDLTQPVSGSAS